MNMNYFDDYESGGFSGQPLFPDDVEGKRKKKSANNAAEQYDSWLNGLGSFGRDRVSPDVERAVRADVDDVKSRIGSYDIAPRSDEEISSRFRETFYDVMAPKATPQRRMMLYSQSDRALDDAFGSDFDDVMKQQYKKNRTESKERARKHMESELSVVGVDPVLATRNALREDNAVSDIGKTINETLPSEMVERIRPLARHSGYSTEEYLNEKVLPKVIPDVYEKLYNEAVEEEKPKSSAEYIMRSAVDNSLLGKAVNMAQYATNLNSDHTDLTRAGLRSYKSNRYEDFAAGVGSLLIDAPAFYLLGAGAAPFASAAAEKLAPHFVKKLSNKLMVAGFGNKVTPEIANEMAGKIAKRTLASKIVQSSTAQGLTLGGYDLAHSIADNIIEGEWGKIGRNLGSFGHGFLTGAALGVVGTPLRMKAQRYENMKKVFASSGVLCAESAVFTASAEARKLLEGVEVAPIDILGDYADAGATLLAMRLARWRPIARNKLNRYGKIKDEYRFSPSEAEELRAVNVNAEKFLEGIENLLHMPSSKRNDYKAVVDTYARLMSNKNLSASAKAKLLYIVENKVSSTPPVPFDFDIVEKKKDKKVFITKDPLGRKISTRVCKGENETISEARIQRVNIRRGRIAVFENELTDGLNSVNFLRQAGIYAKETGMDVEQLSDILYRKAKSSPLSHAEEEIVSDILERSSYDATGMLRKIYDVRRELEDRHGLYRGGLQRNLRVMREDDYHKADEALNEYELFLRKEVDALKSGTDVQLRGSFEQFGADWDFKPNSMADVRGKEASEYNENVERVYQKLYDAYNSREETPELTKVEQDENSKYLWNKRGLKNTKEDIARYGERAKEIGEKLGVDINLINDAREIPLPDINNSTAVTDYNNRLRAMGWIDVSNGKVYVNLPNTASMAELERTVLHEAVGHKGLSHVFGYKLNDFIENLLRKASPEVLRGIEANGYKYKGSSRYTIVEEYLAHLAEKVLLTPKERSIFTRVKDYIKNRLIRMRLYTGNNRSVSEAELTEIMQRHCEYMMKEAARKEHRREVFGDFEVSHKGEKQFYDHDAYIDNMRNLIDKGILLPSTPRYLRNTKGIISSEYMSPEQKVRMNYHHKREWLRNNPF